MPAFETPQPIRVTVELGIGVLRLTAGDRTDTVVEVRPSDPTDDSDVKVAEETRVDYGDGELHVTAPRIRTLDFSRRSRSVDVSIELPAGSRVQAHVQCGDIHSTGPLGECRVKTGAGHVRLGDTGPLRLDTGAGHVAVGMVAGSADITTGTGRVRLQGVDGPVTVKNSNGDTEIGDVHGEARIRSANGDITVGRVTAPVDAKTSAGTIRVGEAVAGSFVLKTGYGDVEVGIADGTAAWLDVHTGFGRVRNTLSEAGPTPATARDKAEVHARTSFGDVSIRRA